MENVVFNIGCTTKNGVEMDVESMINAIGKRTDCTITRTVAFIRDSVKMPLKWTFMMSISIQRWTWLSALQDYLIKSA